MERILIFEDEKKIDDVRRFYGQIADNLNSLLDAFHSCQSEHRIDSEAAAYAFGQDPLSYLIKQSGIKPTQVKSKRQEIPGIAEFREAVNRIALQPGVQMDATTGPGGRIVKRAGYRITKGNSRFIQWMERFSVNQAELERECDKFRKYATSQDQIATVKRWESLADQLNQHHQPINPDKRAEVAGLLGLEYFDHYEINYKSIL